MNEACVKPGLCWLKNMYCKADEEFYSELGARLDVLRKKEVRWRGTPKQMKRRAAVFLFDHPAIRSWVTGSWVHETYDWLRNSSRPLRKVLKRRLHINLTDAA